MQVRPSVSCLGVEAECGVGRIGLLRGTAWQLWGWPVSMSQRVVSQNCTEARSDTPGASVSQASLKTMELTAGLMALGC